MTEGATRPTAEQPPHKIFRIFLAAHAPGPLGKRLQANAGRLRATADAHDSTAQPAEALT